nr:hypothetical protein [Tanacetum cinerariifolium]
MDKLVKDEDEELYASKFSYFVFLNEEDFGTRIEPMSHKENPKTIDDDDDDDNDDHNDHVLIKNRRTGSSEDRNDKMQTPILLPPRSPMIDLSLGALKRICRHQGFMIRQMEKKYVTNRKFQDIKESVDKVLYDIVPKIASDATNDLIDDNLLRVVADAVQKEREALKDTIPILISKEFADHAPKIIEELFKIYMKNNDDLKHKFEKSSASISSCRDDAFHICDHDEHQGDDGPLEGEKSAKRQKTSKGSKSTRCSLSNQLVQGSKTYASERQQQQKQEWDALVEKTVIDEDRYLYNKDVFFLKYGNSKERKYVHSLLKIHVVPFPEEDLEEMINYKPTTGLIYLNIKEEKRVMDLIEIVKFYDATLERVLKEVKLMIFETEFLKKASLLGELDLDIIKAYKRDIIKRLRHREQLIRYESFVNGAPILPTLKRQ